jgi:hypothetical protein
MATIGTAIGVSVGTLALIAVVIVMVRRARHAASEGITEEANVTTPEFANPMYAGTNWSPSAVPYEVAHDRT